VLIVGNEYAAVNIRPTAMDTRRLEYWQRIYDTSYEGLVAESHEDAVVAADRNTYETAHETRDDRAIDAYWDWKHAAPKYVGGPLDGYPRVREPR
jgi:hypothetical protein